MKYYSTRPLFYSKNPRNKNGYSLIELALIIILISITSISILPKFFDSLSFTSRTYFDDVLSSVRYAQKLAVAMGCDVQLSLASDTITINLRTTCNSGSFTTDLRDPSFGQSSFTRQAPSGVSISSSDLPIYFDSLGRAHDSSTSLVLSSDANITVDSRVLSIVGETGFAYGS